MTATRDGEAGGRRCAVCLHEARRHNLEPPYSCYECECEAFQYVRPAPPAEPRIVAECWTCGKRAPGGAVILSDVRETECRAAKHDIRPVSR